ncbi:BirA family biotin operon repressor/biotin-[acetyl-CoA-carboxylase] ligase [Cryobacterium sp. MP_M5]|uniref:biotin--[acetyl-CoA-carboxylase] ligase n=1 Tax=unclassified Cryobacterium TaxID=2649013 RepID=UPI0018C9E14D|nr:MULTISPECIES: biotin--[acetyl-CoA-carboxylase] ligase [unclassified Cryobacterium]MBG6058539.1 BirA family biotin operon repressor/biotin-[acetyl-CoA-carboxylase] ligase [Cryobacterium sp. MP_M3]MEC5177177.1 BirA family biotin operon repressor/biotin-[acetyl-CoA-carboxylase] ligase [Cryobacterium sp. MP_M5]
MEFPLSRDAGARFEYLAEAGSTNDVLVAHATGADAAAWPDLSVVVTDNQTRGRGRLGRTWLAPTGKSLAISVLLRPVHAGAPLPVDHFGWFPLLAGTAMTRAVREVVDAGLTVGPEPDEGRPVHEVTLKWPNDVLIDGYKVSGILSELLPDARGLVIGTGLNVSLDEHDLPTLTSTSLMLVTGSAPDPDAVLARYLTELRGLTGAFLAAGGDPVRSGLLAAVRDVCGTLGAPVRVQLPGGDDLVGVAIDLDRDGRLIVEDQANGELQAVAAGDVTHLRY